MGGTVGAPVTPDAESAPGLPPLLTSGPSELAQATPRRLAMLKREATARICGNEGHACSFGS